MEDLLRYMVKSLVDNPDSVDIQKIEGEKTIILELKVAEGDVGKVIGKHGKTINAIRTIVKVTKPPTIKLVCLMIFLVVLFICRWPGF